MNTRRAIPKIAFSVRVNVETYDKLKEAKRVTGQSFNTIIKNLIQGADFTKWVNNEQKAG